MCVNGDWDAYILSSMKSREKIEVQTCPKPAMIHDVDSIWLQHLCVFSHCTAAMFDRSAGHGPERGHGFVSGVSMCV